MTRIKRSFKFVVIIENNDEFDSITMQFIQQDTSMNFATLINSSQSYLIITSETARKTFVKIVTKKTRVEINVNERQKINNLMLYLSH